MEQPSTRGCRNRCFENLRDRIAGFMSSGQLRSAVYWADKLYTLSGFLCDFVLYVQCLIEGCEYNRAFDLIHSRQYQHQHVLFRWLAVRCLFHGKKFDDAIYLVESPLESKINLSAQQRPQPSCSSMVTSSHLSQADMAFLDSRAEELRVAAGLKLLTARLHEQLDNKKLAVEFYREALLSDLMCIEALEALVNHCLLKPAEEKKLLDSMPFQSLPDPMSREVVKYLYSSTMCKLLNGGVAEQAAGSTNLNLEPPLPPGPELASLEKNASILTVKAERYYYLGDFRRACECVEEVLKKERLHAECLPVRICLLIESGESQKLFTLAHKLVDELPYDPLSWYAVGAYYYSVELYPAAQRLFHKSLSLDSHHGAGWLALGHSLALMSQHDQAMNAYMKAARVMQGCHLPQLYIGLEYCLTNNAKLGEQFFADAYALAPRDPHVMHEMGVMAFKGEQYDAALGHFQNALASLEAFFGAKARLPRYWEPLLNNLGHTCRKLGRYVQALEFHKRALSLVPLSASTVAVMGVVHLLNGDPTTAISLFHQSLSLKRDIKHVAALLSKTVDLATSVLSDRVDPTKNWPEPSDELPKITFVPYNSTIATCAEAEEADVLVKKSAGKTEDPNVSNVTEISMDESDVVMEMD